MTSRPLAAPPHGGSAPAERIDGRDYRSGTPIRLSVQDGKIAAVEPLALEDEALPWLGPGLVDLQVNGYRGLDLNEAPLQPELVERLAQELNRDGVTSFLPTIVTNSDDAVEQAMRAIAAACSEAGAAAAAVAGIHLEGPFISPKDGPRGAHDVRHVKAPDWRLFRRWQDAAGGLIRLVTLAPEWPGTPDFVTACVGSGVTVAIGHTGATPEQIDAAVAAGARLSTHLGNGTHLALPRHPNYLWEQLADDRLWASVIADGFHVPASVLKVILRVKGPRAFLVSDLVSLSGMPAGEYTMPIGGRVVLTEHRKLHLHESPDLLAGSVQPLAGCLSYLVDHGLASLAEAWEMCSVRPARLLGLASAPGLSAGAPADLVALRETREGYRVEAVYVGGWRVGEGTT